MCSPSAPPDPVATAQAQNQVNEQAIANAAKYNRTNQVTPTGTLTYSGTPGGPDDTVTTALSPELQRILSGQIGITQGLTDLANQRMQSIPQTPFELPQNPNGNNPLLDARANNPLQTTFGDAGAVQHNLSYNPNIQNGVNGDFGSQIQQAQNAAYGAQTQYLDPQFQRQQQQLESQLAAQGIPVGSEAYTNAMNQFTESRNQAYQGAMNAAVGAGNQEQNTLYGQQLAGGQFANQAQQQSYEQALGTGQFGNQAQQQYFDQLANRAQFYNQAQGQQFNQGMDIMNYNLQANMANQGIYQQNLADQIQGRQENFNELAAFLNGSPVSPTNPTFQNTPVYNAAQASPDAVGLAGSNYNSQSQARAAILGSIFGAAGKAGSAAIAACWVAREVYGTSTNRWMMFRHYLLTKAPKLFRMLYLKYGPRFASFISDKPRLKALIHSWMEARIAAYA